MSFKNLVALYGLTYDDEIENERRAQLAIRDLGDDCRCQTHDADAEHHNCTSVNRVSAVGLGESVSFFRSNVKGWFWRSLVGFCGLWFGHDN